VRDHAGGGVLAFYADEMRARRQALVRLLGWSLLGAAPAFVSGRSIAQAVDRGFLAGRPYLGVAWLLPMVFAGLLAAVAVRRLNPLLGDVVEPMRDNLVRAVVVGNLRKSVSSGAPPDSRAVAQFVGQTDAVRDITADLLGSAFSSTAAMLAAVVGLSSLDPLAALLVVAPAVATIGIVAALVPTLASRTRTLVETDEHVATVTTATLMGVRDIVACGAEGRAHADSAEVVRAHAAATRSLARAVAWRTVIASIGAQAPIVLLLAMAPWLVGDGHLSIGGLLGAVTYTTMSLQPALRSAVESVAISWVQVSVTLRRLICPAEAPALWPPPWPLPRRPGPERLDLRATDLTFAYGPGADPIVQGLDLHIRPGEHLAVVGPSGVGKSTLGDLLAGLTEADAGQVHLGGMPVNDMARASLRQAIALIPQEAYVFVGTVRDNLIYLRPEASDGDLDRAADATGLRPLVERLGGYDAVLAGDEGLSAGERQLIALTRVWLSPAGIVVLDEATCHLDPAAEARAELAFQRRPGSLIVIAHRISSALRADRILVMDGTGVHLGSHVELLANCPAYAQLVREWQGG
jgi:ATP-binding cassette subfamily C protein